jgi:hypothetical protein
MHTLQPLRLQITQTNSNMSTPIATLSNPSFMRILIAQPPHQLRPRPRSPPVIPPCLHRFPRKRIPRQRRNNKVERIPSIPAVGFGVDEFLNHMTKLQHRARPAVRHDHRESILMFRADVQEVDFHAVDGGCELRVGVEESFASLPVVFRLPVSAESLDG